MRPQLLLKLELLIIITQLLIQFEKCLKSLSKVSSSFFDLGCSLPK